MFTTSVRNSGPGGPGEYASCGRRFALALCIFPFEEKFFGDAGVPVKFIGHPLVGNVAASQSREAFFVRHGLNPAKPLVTILPGSRSSEITRHLGLLQEACVRFKRRSRAVRDRGSAGPRRVATARLGQQSRFPNRRRSNLRCAGACHASIVSSGTATVEAALLDAPMVVVYRVTPLTAILARPLVRTKFFSMVNLISGREVIPELIQNDFTPDNSPPKY